jgi:hypothetical protein
METIIPWVRTILSTTPTRWLDLAGALPLELLTRPPAAQEWSAIECLQHLVDTERGVFPVRIKAILAGQAFPAFNPDQQGTKLKSQPSPAELAQEFSRLRSESLAVLAQVGPDDLGLRAVHQELGPVTMRELLHEWAGHDLMHTVQAERALLQFFIEGCGPWQGYFADHDIRLKK